MNKIDYELITKSPLKAMDEIKTILLVDDNKTTLHLNSWLLKEFFPEENIHMRSSGRDALDFIKDHTENSVLSNSFYPLLIFCDIHMPDLGGWDLVNYLKSDTDIDLEQIYIVLLSAYVQPKSTEQKCADSNVICLNKPLMEENIEEIKQTFALAF